jgi:hypothetical protein
MGRVRIGRAGREGEMCSIGDAEGAVVGCGAALCLSLREVSW